MIPVDHVIATAQDRVDLVQPDIGVLDEDLLEVDLRGRHRQRVAVERADLLDVTGDHAGHRLLRAPDRTARQPVPSALAKATRSGCTPNASIAPPHATVKPVFTSS